MGRIYAMTYNNEQVKNEKELKIEHSNIPIQQTDTNKTIEVIVIAPVPTTTYFAWLTPQKIVSFCHCAGILLTNLCIGLLGSTSTQILKTLEPISTIIISKLTNSSYELSKMTILSIMMIILGSIVTMKDGFKISMIGFIVAFISNCVLPCRNVVIRRMVLENRPNETKSNSAIIFLNSSKDGVLLMLPLIIIKMILTGNLIKLNINLIMSGIYLNGYQLASFLVLNHVSAVDHSVLNIFKRVFVIMSSMLYFHEALSQKGVVGISILFSGLYLYEKSRQEKIKIDLCATISKIITVMMMIFLIHMSIQNMFQAKLIVNRFGNLRTFPISNITITRVTV